MLSTVIVVTLFFGTLILSIVLWAMLLRLGLRWAKVPNVTTRRVVVTTGIVTVIQPILYVALRLVPVESDVQEILLGVSGLAIGVLVPCLVIARVFEARFLRSIQAWLPTLILSVALPLIAYFVVRPFVYEAFVITSNSMAPTLLGAHWRGVCQECGQPSFCSPIDSRYALRRPQQMICENFHVTETPSFDEQVHSSDRILVAKFLAPRRWDLVVFEFPDDPKTQYVHRLVGLPGETIHIEDGAVWADDNKLTPPDSLGGIEYLSEIAGFPELWGTRDRPAVLGDDEYYVLGDFSANSRDSRLWERGAPGHKPFAVPKSHLRGVVTHIYWPPQRWCVLR
jgi:signal peptidase I